MKRSILAEPIPERERACVAGVCGRRETSITVQNRVSHRIRNLFPTGTQVPLTPRRAAPIFAKAMNFVGRGVETLLAAAARSFGFLEKNQPDALSGVRSFYIAMLCAAHASVQECESAAAARWI